MIDPKRIAELMECFNQFPGDALAIDLLAILSDYEAALPLLVAVRGAEFPFKCDGSFWSDDEIAILHKAKLYWERSGHCGVGPRYDPNCDCPDCRKERSGG